MHEFYLGIDRRMVFKWILKKLNRRGQTMTYLAEARDQWWAVVRVVMNLWVL